jgi:anti-sigma regulatory factor (Ser/Thr protein kinase)
MEDLQGGMAMQTLVLPGTLDALEPVADFIKAAAEAAGLDSRATYKLRLAVDEIATNVVTYGYERAGCAGDLKVTVEIDPKTLTISLEDTGVTYDPVDSLDLEIGNVHKPLEQRPIGGLGVYLAIKGVDRFVYERHENRNCNIFIVNRK